MFCLWYCCCIKPVSVSTLVVVVDAQDFLFAEIKQIKRPFISALIYGLIHKTSDLYILSAAAAAAADGLGDADADVNMNVVCQ